jgi:site-specific DNA-methyltransferase (adenine-specific)
MLRLFEAFSGYGGASRFFYVAKASKKERNAGCEELEAKNQRNPENQNQPKKNFHPTCKPLKLMEYLCKLTKTPIGGIVLDPYLGSGTTALAALNVGRQFIGIEISPEYCEIARNRVKVFDDKQTRFD